MELIVKRVRLSYPDLWTAKEFQQSGMKYGCALLIPKNDPQVAVINNIIDTIGREKFDTDKSKKWDIMRKGLVTPQQICFTDGDLKGDDGYAGHMVLRATRKVEAGPPMILDHNAQQVGQGGVGAPYAGCYVNAKVDFWAQNNDTGKTVRATLVTVQFARDGESFSSAKPATADGFEPEPQEDPLADSGVPM